MIETCGQCKLPSTICCEIFSTKHQKDISYCPVCCPNRVEHRKGFVEAEVRTTGDDQNMTQDDFDMFCKEATTSIQEMNPEQMVEHYNTLLEAIKRLKVHAQVTIRTINIAKLEMTEKERKDLMEYDKKFKEKAKNIDGEKRKRQTSNEQLILLMMKEHNIDRDMAVEALSLIMRQKNESSSNS